MALLELVIAMFSNAAIAIRVKMIIYLCILCSRCAEMILLYV